jgi:hypothetical protein
MATNAIGLGEAANHIPTIIADKAVGLLPLDLPMARNVSKHTEWSGQFNQGQTLQIPKRGTLSVNDKTADTAVTVQTPSDDKVDVVLNKHKEVTFRVEDIVKTVDSNNIEIDEGYLADALQKLGEKVEEDLAGLATSLTGVTGGLGTGGTDITDAVLRQCRSGLSKQRAPKADRYIFLDEDQIDVILGLDKFVNAEKYGATRPVQEGELGRIYGFTILEEHFSETSGSSPLTTHNIAMHKDAIVLASRPMIRPMTNDVKVNYFEKDGIIYRILMTWNDSYLANQITIDTLYGVKVVRPELGIDLKS